MRSCDWCPYKYEKFVLRHTYRVTLCEDEGRNWGDAFISQDAPKIDSKPPETRGETWNRFLLMTLRRNQPVNTNLKLLASRIVRK